MSVKKKNKVYDELIDYLKSTISPAELYDNQDVMVQFEQKISEAENKNIIKSTLGWAGIMAGLGLCLTSKDDKSWPLFVLSGTLPGAITFYIFSKRGKEREVLGEKMAYAEYLQAKSEQENGEEFDFSSVNKKDFNKINQFVKHVRETGKRGYLYIEPEEEQTM